MVVRPFHIWHERFVAWALPFVRGETPYSNLDTKDTWSRPSIVMSAFHVVVQFSIQPLGHTFDSNFAVSLKHISTSIIRTRRMSRLAYSSLLVWKLSFPLRSIQWHPACIGKWLSSSRSLSRSPYPVDCSILATHRDPLAPNVPRHVSKLTHCRWSGLRKASRFLHPIMHLFEQQVRDPLFTPTRCKSKLNGVSCNHRENFGWGPTEQHIPD
jgi:hypothetical protein